MMHDAGRAGKAMTPEGDAYTLAEIEKMSKDAGFSRVEMVETSLGFGRMIVAYR
jgi:hypothetical protein